MKKNLAASLLLGLALFASLPRKTCYQSDFQGYRVQVDTITRWGRTTSFVVLAPSNTALPTIVGDFEKGECSFLTLSNPHRFAAEPAKSKDSNIKQAWSLLETSRIAVQVDANVVRPYTAPLWIRVAKLVPHRFL